MPELTGLKMACDTANSGRLFVVRLFCWGWWLCLLSIAQPDVRRIRRMHSSSIWHPFGECDFNY